MKSVNSIADWLFAVLLALFVSLAVAGTAQAQEFLPPDEAFQVRVQAADPDCRDACMLSVDVQAAPDYYLYRERFELKNPQGLASFEFQNLPNGKKKFDENLGMEIEALRGAFSFQIVYSLDESGLPPALELVSQGCADAGLCYPPQSLNAFDPPQATSGLGGFLSRLAGGGGSASFGAAQVDAQPFSDPPVAQSLSGSVAASDSNLAAESTDAGSGQTFGLDEAGSLASRLAGESWWFVLPVFFGLGLLLAFTPCTLPMLPIVTSLIVGQSAENNGRGAAQALKSVSLALVYVVGMALTYAVLGVVAGLSGQSLVVALQTPAVLWSFGALIALLGFALLLGYQIQMPSGMQTWIQNKTGGLKGGQYAPVLLMGVLSALLLGPCVAPPLAGALLYIGQTGNALLGGLALFLLALGMGLPMVIVAAGAGTLLPKAGHWMSVVSGIFGFVLIAVALWVIQPVTDVTLMYGLWVVWLVAAAAGASLVVGQKLVSSAGAVMTFRAVSVLAQSLTLLYLVGFFTASDTLLNPLQKLTASQAGRGAVVLGGNGGALSGGSGPTVNSTGGSTVSGTAVSGSGVSGSAVGGSGVADSELGGMPAPALSFGGYAAGALTADGHLQFENVASEDIEALLASSNVPVMLDFYADWCVSCKEFELFTLTDAGVKNLLQGVRLVRVDVTENDVHDQKLMRKYGLFGPPAILFFQAEGFEMAAQRVIGFQNAAKFSRTLKEVRMASGLTSGA